MTEKKKICEQILEISNRKNITIVGIDGMGGAGKSTFANELKQLLSATHHVIVFHIDDFITPRNIRYNEAYPEWECYYELQWRYDYFVNEVIKKILKAPERIEAELYHKETDTYYIKEYMLTTPAIIIVEGVFLQRQELQDIYDFMIYMDIPENVRLQRVLERDTYIGNDAQIAEKYVNRYFPAEKHYIQTCKPVEKADYVLRKNMPLSTFSAVIFDMDGIIFDSEQLKLNNWISLAQKENIPDIASTFRKCIGLNSEGNQRIFQETYGDTVDFDDFKAKADRLYHEAADHGKLPQKPGIKELLSFFKKHGLKIGVASSTRETIVKQQITDGGLLEYFDIILGGDNVKNGKPDPEIYLKACDSLGVRPNEAIAIEDSFHGIRSASSAGMYVIMVPDLAEPTEDISKLCICVQPDHFRVIDYLQPKTRSENE